MPSGGDKNGHTEVELTDQEYVVGFYGDFNDYLEGFGLFVGNETFT